MVLVKLVLAFGFQALSLFLDFLLFAVVALGFLLEVPQRRSMRITGGCALGHGQGIDDLTTDLVNMALGALGLVNRPLVGGPGLFQDRLVDGMSGEQRADCGEHGKHRGAVTAETVISLPRASEPCSWP